MVEEVFIFPYCKHQILTVTQLGNKGKVEGWAVVGRTAQETSAGQAGACLGLLAPLSAAPSWCSPAPPPPNTSTSSQRQTKQASEGNVQNRNQKMSTSSRQTSKQRKKTSCQSLSRAGVGGWGWGAAQVSFGLFLSLSPCVSLNTISFLISLKHK